MRETTGANKLDIVVTLVNHSDQLIAYTCSTEMIVNSARVCSGESQRPNFVAAGQPASLIFSARDVPIISVNDTVGSVNILLVYLVRYAYASNWDSAAKRTTSKTIVLQAPVWLGAPDQTPAHNKVYPRFADEQET